MATMTPTTTIADRVDGLDWAALGEQLDERGFAQLAPVANRWAQRLSGENPLLPETHDQLLARCRQAGQTRPTPLILRYRTGDWNALHQDLYGEVYFPLQVLTVLSDPGEYCGGDHRGRANRPRCHLPRCEMRLNR
jgi:hypothetical protein